MSNDKSLTFDINDDSFKQPSEKEWLDLFTFLYGSELGDTMYPMVEHGSVLD